jgi:hypothetical protein
MTDRHADSSHDLRTGLVEMLRATCDAEREIFAAFDPSDRDAPAADGGWSARDVQAHLSAWRRRTSERLAAIREGGEEPSSAQETDEVNVILHAERAGWPWTEVTADADATTAALIREVESASTETLALDRISGTIMGNGSEHTLTHLPPIAARVGLEGRVLELADAIESTVAEGGWPSRPAAYARYNLACFHALGEQEELQTFAPDDDDLIAFRAEIPSLTANDASRLRADVDAVIDPISDA